MQPANPYRNYPTVADGSSYKLGLFMAAVSALILLMAGLFICFIVKR